MSPAAALLLALAAAASAQDAAVPVARAMAKVDALVARERGQDAQAVAALDKQAEAVQKELSPLGWRAADALGAAASDRRRAAKARVFAVTFLSKIHDPAAYEPLTTVLLDADQDPDVRLSAAQGLAVLDVPPQAARKAFCAALGQKDLPRSLFDQILIPLERLGCEEPAALERAVRRFGPRPEGLDFADVRRALKALARSRGTATARALLGLVAWYPPRGQARAAAIAAVAERRADLATALGPETMAMLREALRTESDSAGPMVSLVRLADAFGPEADELLLPLASHPDPEVLAEAAEALARRKLVAALPGLEKVAANALNDPRFAPKPGRADTAPDLARIEAAVESLRRARAARK